MNAPQNYNQELTAKSVQSRNADKKLLHILLSIPMSILRL